MENKTLKSSWAAAFALGSCWFGTHVGGGFASGNQVIAYFSQYGYSAAIIPALSMALLAVIIGIVVRFAKVGGYDNYHDTFAALYPKPWMEIFFEIFYTIIVLAAVAAAVTGAGNVLANFLGIDYSAGANTILFNLLIVAILIVLTIFGVKLVIAASTVLSIGIIVTSILIVIVGFAADYESIAAAVTAEVGVTALAAHTNDIGNAIWRGLFVYAGFQCVSIPPMIAASKDFSLKGVTRGSILGGIMNGVILALSGAMLAKWYPLLAAIKGLGSYGNTLSIPNQTVLTLIGIKVILAAFSILCFCAFVSTCVTLIYTMVQRYQKKVFPNSIKNEKIRSVIIGAVVIGICFAISLLGLSTIIVKLYGFDGYYGLIVIVIPAIIWGIPKTRKMLAEKKAAGIEV